MMLLRFGVKKMHGRKIANDGSYEHVVSSAANIVL